MLPYIGATQFMLFGVVPIQVWGAFVACGFVVGTFVAYKRAQRLGLQAEHVLDLVIWILVAALIGSRLFHIIAYAWPSSWSGLWRALDPREPGYAIFGGFMGAFLATFAYLRKHRLPFFPYADVLAWGLPWGCGVGRIGCFLIHDHPGTLSHTVLAIKYPNGESRHDLGLYLSLIGFMTGIVFLCINRSGPRGPGFYLGAYMVMEAASRLALDTLRIADARYFSLTPTQWLALPLFVGGVVLMRYSRTHAYGTTKNP